jgi:hypothetical protein
MALPTVRPLKDDAARAHTTCGLGKKESGLRKVVEHISHYDAPRSVIDSHIQNLAWLKHFINDVIFVH